MTSMTSGNWQQHESSILADKLSTVKVDSELASVLKRLTKNQLIQLVSMHEQTIESLEQTTQEQKETIDKLDTENLFLKRKTASQYGNENEDDITPEQYEELRKYAVKHENAHTWRALVYCVFSDDITYWRSPQALANEFGGSRCNMSENVLSPLYRDGYLGKFSFNARRVIYYPSRWSESKIQQYIQHQSTNMGRVFKHEL